MISHPKSTGKKPEVLENSWRAFGFVLLFFQKLCRKDMRKEGNDSLLKTQRPQSYPIVSENNNKTATLSGKSLPEKGVHLLLRLFTFGEETEGWCNFPTVFRIQALLKFHFLELFIFFKIRWHFGKVNYTLLYLEKRWISRRLSV